MNIMSTTSIAPLPLRQRGAAALFVTLMLVAIATIATLYANRSAYLFQRSSVNQYQYNLALGAAEAGMNAFIAQVEADFQNIDTSSTTIIEKAAGGGGGAASCLPGSGASNVQFKNTYATANNQIFDSAKYFTGTYSLVSSPASDVNPALAYRVQGRLDGGMLSIISEGCMGNTGSGHNTCSGDVPRAKVRRQVKISGGISLGDTAVTIGGYADTRLSMSVKANSGDPNPTCAVLFGDSYNSVGSHVYQCKASNCAPQKEPSLATNLFKKTFGKDKGQIRALAQASGTEFNTCPPSSGDYSNKIVWIEGSLTSGCNINGSKTVVVVNGNISGGTLKVTSGLVYANNFYHNGSVHIIGSLIVENSWDKGPLGDYYTNGYHQFPNHKDDATTPYSDALPNPPHSNPTSANLQNTHTGEGSFEVTYKKINFDIPGLDGELDSNSKSWIDF